MKAILPEFCKKHTFLQKRGALVRFLANNRIRLMARNLPSAAVIVVKWFGLV